MNNILQRIAYLQGLADGLGVEGTKEGELLLEVIDALGDAVEEIYEELKDLEDYVDVIEEDLGDLEDYVYEDDLDFDDLDELDFYDDFDDYDYEEECECGCCSEDVEGEEIE